jgi:hypothetical protein
LKSTPCHSRLDIHTPNVGRRFQYLDNNERIVRGVPDVAVNGTGGSNGLVDGLLGTMQRRQKNG